MQAEMCVLLFLFVINAVKFKYNECDNSSQTAAEFVGLQQRFGRFQVSRS
jgi:hypothetical protein